MALLKISYIIIYRDLGFVKRKFCIFQYFFGNDSFEVIAVKSWKKPVLFILGGLAYVGLELLWRGRSHGSMFLAGGACFLLLGKLYNTEPRLPLPFRALAGAGIITMVEMLMGLIVNGNYQVWDYRNVPLNFHGQICLPFFLLWIPVSIGAMLLYKTIEKRLS